MDLKKHQNKTSRIGEKRIAFTPERAIETCRAENARQVKNVYAKEYGFVQINKHLALVKSYYREGNVDGV